MCTTQPKSRQNKSGMSATGGSMGISATPISDGWPVFLLYTEEKFRILRTKLFS